MPAERTDDLSFGVTVKGFASGQKLFGRFSLQRRLGAGGMGVVWLAEDEKLKRSVALKFLPEFVRLDAGAVDDLKRETRRCLDLTHPNIVRVYDLHEDDAAAAIAMEYVDGQTLTALRLAQGSGVLEPGQIGPWLPQLCAALDYAHQQARVVHRDLKPVNLMVNRRGELKVMDFGIARSLSSSMSRLTLTQVGTSGTLPYMSPQQVMGEDASPLDDVYSLGITLYELLTGKPPFYEGELVTQIREKTPPPMNRRRAALGVNGAAPIPAAWEAVVAACLAKDPAQRPQSARTVAEELGLGRRTEGGGQRADDRGQKTEDGRDSGIRGVRLKFGNWVLAAGILLGVLGIGYWAFKPARPATVAAKPVEQSVRPDEGQAKRDAEARAKAEAEAEAKHVAAAEQAKRDVEAKAKAEAEAQRVAAAEQAKQEEEARKAAFVAHGLASGERWTNGLGMVFAPVAGVKVLFGVWDVRVQDFEAFVKATGYDATAGMISARSNGWSQVGDTWKSPGFSQGPTHPVCGVSWEDATNFCGWLTERERKEGRLTGEQVYRLPTDAEWSVAVGLAEPSGGTPQEKNRQIKDVYPWGTEWPPPAGAGNYGGEEAKDGNWPSSWPVIAGYRDGYARTSPVGSFKGNQYGLYDMGGNVWQWCEDFYNGKSGSRVLRGGSWISGDSDLLLSSCRNVNRPDFRNGNYGFRCVVVTGGSVR